MWVKVAYFEAVVYFGFLAFRYLCEVNILLLGSGGREHAFAMKINECEGVNKFFIAPGNAGTSEFGENVALNPSNVQEVFDFCRKQAIDLVIPGNEDPLVSGITDFIEIESKKFGLNIAVAGPSWWCAQLEGSKEFAKSFMQRHQIPTARYGAFRLNEFEEAKSFMRSLDPPYVLKADGLAGGKGVIITESFDEACEILLGMIDGSKFGRAGEVVVIEEFLKGIELSVFGISDGESWQVLASAKDYKRIFDNDLGPNTGGMGAISPVPFANEDFMEKVVDRILKPTYDGLAAERHPYKGFLFVGLMNLAGDPYVIEYNVRMGDPETEAIFPRLKTPILQIVDAIANGGLKNLTIELDKRTAATIFLVSGGYPGDFQKGKAIRLPISHDLDSQWLFHAGTKMVGGQLQTNGGRVIAVTSLDNDIKKALQRSKELAAQVEFDDKFHRTDIGLDLIK